MPVRILGAAACAAFLATTIFDASMVRAESLDRALLRHAPEILAKVDMKLKDEKDKGLRNLGVLKFRVIKGHAPITDNAGELNLAVAQKLELALVLAMRDDENAIGIIKDASAQAATIKGANHLTAEGREKFFGDQQYQLVWGNQKVQAVGFLTGVVKVSPGWRTMTIGIIWFDRKDKTLQKIMEFDVDTGAAESVGLGASFLRRDLSLPNPASPSTDAPAADIAQGAADVQLGLQPSPLNAEAKPPVELIILYYDQDKKIPDEKLDKVAIVEAGRDEKDVRSEVPTPRENQNVAFIIRRTDAAPKNEKLAVVLKVNGENTIYGEKNPNPFYCTKWVLGPDQKEGMIRGFEGKQGEASKFKTLSDQESLENEINYGSDVGTISLVVFREKRATTVSPQPTVVVKINKSRYQDASLFDWEAKPDDVSAMKRNIHPKSAENLADAKRQVRGSVEEGPIKGLIVPGEKFQSGAQNASIDPDPNAVMAVTVRYYTPKAR